MPRQVEAMVAGIMVMVGAAVAGGCGSMRREERDRAVELVVV